MVTLILHVMVAALPTKAICFNGQSLALGLGNSPALTSTTYGDNSLTSSIALALDPFGNIGEGVEPASWPWSPLNETSFIGGLYESPRSQLAKVYFQNTGNSVFICNGAWGSSAYVEIQKGTVPWNYMMSSMEAFTSRTNSTGQFVGIYLRHGEGDIELMTSRSQYTADIIQMQADFEAKVHSLGGTGTIPLYLDQVSTWTATALTNHAATSVIPLAQSDACLAQPSKVICIGALYWSAFAGDGVHKLNTTYETQGQMAGKVITFGPTWVPTRMTGVTRIGAAITVTFYAPVPPLVIDTSVVSDPGSYGFVYTDSNGTGTINSVGAPSCVGNSCTVVVTLSATPSGTSKTIGYATVGIDGHNGGPTTGPRGCLHDSDPVSVNYALHQDFAVP